MIPSGRTEAEPAWLTVEDRIEDLESRSRRLAAQNERLLVARRSDHQRAVELALRDLTRTLDRLEELDVSLEIDDVKLSDAADGHQLTATWRTDKAHHTADIRYDQDNCHWHHRESEARRAAR